MKYNDAAYTYGLVLFSQSFFLTFFLTDFLTSVMGWEITKRRSIKYEDVWGFSFYNIFKLVVRYPLGREGVYISDTISALKQ